MRTTLTIDEGILNRLKERAMLRGVTLSRQVEETLRAALAREADAAEEPPFRLVTFRGDGPAPGIDLDKAGQLVEREDIDRYRGDADA